MKPLLLPAFVLSSLVLVQCVDPYYYEPGGGQYPSPYRQEMNAQGAQLNRAAYEQGWRDGQSDAQYRRSQNYQRYRSRFNANTETAYRDGYQQGYAQMGTPPNMGSADQGNYGAPMSPQSPSTHDPAYNQGYDYGLRDLTNGRPADPTAYVGRYDPRYRSSFERGYGDAFNSRQGGQSSSSGGAGSSNGFWFR